MYILFLKNDNHSTAFMSGCSLLLCTKAFEPSQQQHSTFGSNGDALTLIMRFSFAKFIANPCGLMSASSASLMNPYENVAASLSVASKGTASDCHYRRLRLMLISREK
jgi:hypothetical protein